MRILLDECVPRRLRREFAGHDVRKVPEMGWSCKKNGELLQLMVAQGFEVLLTVDQNLRHQQKLQAAGVAVVILVAPSNRLADLVPLAPSVQAALSSIKAGDVVEVATLLVSTQGLAGSFRRPMKGSFGAGEASLQLRPCHGGRLRSDVSKRKQG
jgi:hypothetical protein